MTEIWIQSMAFFDWNEIQSMPLSNWNGGSLIPICVTQFNHILAKTGIWIQSMALSDWNENSANALVWLEMGITQCPCLTGMGITQCPCLTGMGITQCPWLTGMGISQCLCLTGWEYSTVKICQSNLCYTIYPDISKNLKKRRFKKNKFFHWKLNRKMV